MRYKRFWGSQLLTLILLILILLTITACSSGTPDDESMTEKETITTGAKSIDETMEETTAMTASPEEVVTIKDPELEKMIRLAIDKPEGDITALDMEGVYSINIDYKEYPVREIDGLEYAIYLGDFSYRYGELKSLDPIKDLQNITYMTISYGTVDEAPATFNTKMLSRINFTETNVSDYSFLSQLTEVTSATFIRNGISSIEFLKGWDKIETLDLSTNEIKDVTPLEGKINLTDLTLHQNQIEDISVFETLSSLVYLNISYNNISNIAPIMQLPNLEELRAYEELDKKIIDRGLLEALIAKGLTVDYHK